MKINKLLILFVGVSYNTYSQDTSSESQKDSLLRFNVRASIETTPVRSLDDAADDICVWVPKNPNEPVYIIGTDKKRGLETYDKNGLRVFDEAFGRVNNIDLWNSSIGPIVVGSNRTYNSIDFFKLDSINGSLSFLNRYRTPLEDVYGLTVYQKDYKTLAFITDKSGYILQYDLKLMDDSVIATKSGSFQFSSTVEGIKADPFYERLYVAEEDIGLWTIALDSEKQTPQLIQQTDQNVLIPDLEGVALLALSNGAGYLFVSVQGDNSFAIFDRKSLELLALFRVEEGTQIGAVEETDGIEVIHQGNFSYFITQDGFNEGSQNYKLVPLDQILSHLK